MDGRDCYDELFFPLTIVGDNEKKRSEQSARQKLLFFDWNNNWIELQWSQSVALSYISLVIESVLSILQTVDSRLSSGPDENIVSVPVCPDCFPLNLPLRWWCSVVGRTPHREHLTLTWAPWYTDCSDFSASGHTNKVTVLSTYVNWQGKLVWLVESS